MVNQDTSDLILTEPLGVKLVCCHCANEKVVYEDILFQGIHILVKLSCPSCNGRFFNTLPTGHDLLFPTGFDDHRKIINKNNVGDWLIVPLQKALFSGESIAIEINKELTEQKSEAIILNCIDNCFGHSFSKLWNASVLREKYPDKSIIVFVPKVMRWLVPDCVSEVWSFDSSFNDLEKQIINLDAEVKQNLLPRFEKVWISKAYTHLALSKVNLQAMVKTDRFNLSNFNSSPPSIMFVLREDRFWHRYPIEFFMFKVFVKLKLSKKIFVLRQNYLVTKAVLKIRKQIENATFTATGLGTTGRLHSLVKDERKVKPTSSDERYWCVLCSKTHIVIGVHGSNMLIPTSLAAGFVEILPRHKIRHLAEDTLMDYNSRYSHFLGRYIDHFASPALISQHVISMIQHFPYIYENTEQAI